jgi:RNA polymerase sigma-70 factor (ECF subfamily)
MEWVTTTTILEGLRDYEGQDAWRRLVARFRAPIVGFAAELGVPDGDRPDVAQNTLMAFAEAYRAGKYDREKGRLSSWLFGIAYRQARQQLRRNAKTPLSADSAPSPLNEATATDVWDRLWSRHLLETAIGAARHEFAPETFRAFELVVLEDLAPPSAAERLGVPIKTIYNAKHRVLKRVRELVTELDSPEEDGRVLP